MSAQLTATPATPATRAMLARYHRVRAASERICQPLAVEDYCIQSMPDVSPAKWHLAHTSWFYERFLLVPHLNDYEEKHPQYNYLFNSYYNTVGPQHCRPQRGLISRPTVEEVYDYRRHVDAGMARLLESADAELRETLDPLVTIGLNHEQQHQELMVTDLKHIFSSNPLLPAYHATAAPMPGDDPGDEVVWVPFDEGVYAIGRAPEEDGFCFDNETPRHKVYLQPYALARRPVTNGQYLRFLEDGGYTRHDLWLSAGWATVQEQGWTQPLYWYRGTDGRWMQYTLYGPAPLDPAEPVSHLAFYEADAYARWAGCRLPTEAEWELAADRQGGPIAGNFADAGRFHPRPAEDDGRDDTLQQLFGDVWEWTGTQYRPYPGYKPLPGALGEYNGKFMSNQFVLRGGSCATPQDHIRLTYRNFFDPAARWQFTGLRLAKDL